MTFGSKNFIMFTKAIMSRVPVQIKNAKIQPKQWENYLKR